MEFQKRKQKNRVQHIEATDIQQQVLQAPRAASAATQLRYEPSGKAEGPSVSLSTSLHPPGPGKDATSLSPCGSNTAFLFQRSLRLDDNLGLLKALADTVAGSGTEAGDSPFVLPIFCVDPRQADPTRNAFHSKFSLGFMLHSLEDLREQLKSRNSDLLLLTGQPHEVLPTLLSQLGVTRLYCIKDYTPFAAKRSQQIREALARVSVTMVEEEVDYVLHKPGSVLSKKGMFKVYTPFAQAAWLLPVQKPVTVQEVVGSRTSILASPSVVAAAYRALGVSDSGQSGWDFLRVNGAISPSSDPGGRCEGLRRLAALPMTQNTYDESRGYMLYNSTQLSAYLKFGCISVREAWWAFANLPSKSAARKLQDELLWREYFVHYFAAFPAELEWDADAKLGPNGLQEARLNMEKAPDIVKACYNELEMTGYVNNRGRLILANFLLHAQGEYWKKCDLMFARRLVDYDPYSNAGGWLWVQKQAAKGTYDFEQQIRKWDSMSPVAPAAVQCPPVPHGTYTKHWLNPTASSAAMAARMQRRLTSAVAVTAASAVGLALPQEAEPSSLKHTPHPGAFIPPEQWALMTSEERNAAKAARGGHRPTWTGQRGYR